LRDLYRFIDGRTDRTDEEREGGREEREREREREREGEKKKTRESHIPRDGYDGSKKVRRFKSGGL
jgi:hypothetical protein